MKDAAAMAHDVYINDSSRSIIHSLSFISCDSYEVSNFYNVRNAFFSKSQMYSDINQADHPIL